MIGVGKGFRVWINSYYELNNFKVDGPSKSPKEVGNLSSSPSHWMPKCFSME